MKQPRTPAEQRRAQSATRAAFKRRQKASIGLLRCLCGNTAFHLSSCGPVCERCDGIESKLTRSYAREVAGSNRRGENSATVIAPFAVHAPAGWI